MELVRKDGPRYSNSPAASVYLVKGRRDYLGGYATSILSTWHDWEQFPQVVATGQPLDRHENANPTNTFWEDMVLGLAPGASRLRGWPPSTSRSRMAGARVARRRRRRGPLFCHLARTPSEGESDPPRLADITPIARRYVAGFGYADRAQTIDGDMEQIDLGEARYDFVFYANIAHGLSAA